MRKPIIKFISTEPLIGVADPKPGGGIRPRCFQIYQQKPIPMNPFMVWRGFRGNVYFDPIHINHAELNPKRIEVRFPPIQYCSKPLELAIKKSRCNAQHMVEFRAEQRNRLDDIKYNRQMLNEQREKQRINFIARPTTKVSFIPRMDDFIENPGTLKIQKSS